MNAGRGTHSPGHKNDSSIRKMNTLTTYDECSTVNNFPNRLISLLEDEDVQKVMHWLPCGRAFEIVDPELCAETVLKNHFNSVKFESFIVRLKKWGFSRTDTKVNGRYRSMTFSSELFRRDKPHLCHRMKLEPSKTPKKKKSSKPLSHLFDARSVYHNTTPQKSPTVPKFGCKNFQMVKPSWKYPLWQNSPLSTESTPVEKNPDSTLINAERNMQSEPLLNNVAHHNRYSIPHGVATNLHYMEPLTGPTVQNQKDALSYPQFYHSQAINSMSHPNIDIGLKSTDNNFTNSPAISNRHQVMALGNIFPPRTPVPKISSRPAYGRTNSEPILPRTTKGASVSQLFSSHHRGQKSYNESQMTASNEKSLYKSVSCDESPNDSYRQQRCWCNRFPEVIQKPVVLSEVMEAEDVLHSSDCDENVPRSSEPERREDYFSNPSVRRKNILTRSRLNSDPTADRAHMWLPASASFPGFHPIDSSQSEMDYLPNNERQNAKDEEACFFNETSLAASDIFQPTTAIDLFHQNRQDEVIEYQEPKTYQVDNSCRDSFFDEILCILNDGIDPFTEGDTETRTQRSGSAEYTNSTFEATGKHFVAKSFNALLGTPGQQNFSEFLDNSSQQQKQVEIPAINTDDVKYGGSLDSCATSEAEGLDLRSLASTGSDNNATGDALIDFIEKTIADN
ncbi:hypothetical protein ACHAW6_002779 [Cyclotella cf. meneghiniana]